MTETNIDNVGNQFPSDFQTYQDNIVTLDTNTVSYIHLLQHVTIPTHDSGHTINLVITISFLKIYDKPIFMLDICISGHKTICIDLDLSKPTVHKTTFPVVNLKN